MSVLTGPVEISATPPMVVAEGTVGTVREERNPALDGIRGIAILMVLIFHFNDVGLHNAVRPWLYFVSKWGWSGVDLFFVLSGFLITGILYDAKGSSHYFKNFYVRRAVRIFPAYYIFLTVILLIVPLFAASLPAAIAPTRWGPQSVYWLYVSNFYDAYHAHAEGWASHTWSLSIEEQFYMLWPTIVFLCDRRRMIKVCAAFIGGGLLLRVILLMMHLPILTVYFLTFTRMDQLAMGGLLALLMRSADGKAVVRRTILWAAGAAGVMLASLLAMKKIHPEAATLWEEATKFTCMGIIFASMIGWCVTSAPSAIVNRVAGCGFLRFFGTYSYGIYLWHLPLIMLIGDRFNPNRTLFGTFLSYGIYMSGTIVVGLLSWHLMEKHFLKLKRLFPMEHRKKA